MSELKARTSGEIRARNALLGYWWYKQSEADKVIADLKEERRWRKCSEELPEDGSDVLATDGEEIWLCYKTTMTDGLPWLQPNGQPHIEGVTH